MRFGMMGMTVAVLAAAVPMAARAQGGAEEAARGYVHRLAARDFDAAGAMVAPGMARAFQRQELSMLLAFAQLRASGTPRGNTFAVSGADSVDPAMLARFGGTPARGYGTARTVADAARMEPAAFMARTLEDAYTLPPGACCAGWGTPRYVGIVAENDSVAHALYRDPGEPVPHVTRGDPYAVAVLELRREGGRWYVIPDTSLLMRSHMMTMLDEEPKP